jgi:hypothetical protein
MGDDLKFKDPFSCLMSGTSGSGKTSFCISFLQNLKALCTAPNFRGGIVWCYSKNTIPYQHLAGKKHVRFHEGVPAGFNNSGEKPCLIILDDLIIYAYSKDVCDIFSKGRHHRNIIVILITQNLFHQGKDCRDISLNAKYIVVLKNLRNRDQFSHPARQVLPQYSKGLLQAYLHATEATHGYLVLDQSQDTDDSLRFRTCIFPNKECPFLYVDAGNETHQGKLPLFTY